MCRSSLIGFVFLISALVVSTSLGVRRGETEKEKEPFITEEDKWTVTKTAYFDISIDLDNKGRVEIALFGDAAPNTVNNFAALAKGRYRGDVSYAWNFWIFGVSVFRE